MIILRTGASTTEQELKAFCLERGPAYAHPRLIKIADSFPLNGAGKPDRALVQQTLKSAYAEKAGNGDS